MPSISLLRAGATCASWLFAVSVWPVAPLFSANAPPPPAPPAAFQDLYNTLNADLSAFNATLNSAWNGSRYPVVFAGNLSNANGNSGTQLLNGGNYSGAQLELQQLKALGVQAVVVQAGFPILYQPFYTYLGQPQLYGQFVSYYQQVAQNVRAAGLRLIVENDVLLSTDVASPGFTMAPYYATLNWTQFQAARAQCALTTAETLQPDYLVVLEEPDSQAAQTGQSNVNTASGAASLVSQMLATLQPVRGAMKVGAGMSTAQAGFQNFVQSFLALPLDFLDMHIYPINSLGPPSNNNFLANALTMAAMAQAAGKPVSISEAWMWKMRNSEWNVLSAMEIRARNPFSFWAPLDAYFLQIMDNLANYTQMLFMAPEGPEYFWAYQPYDSSTENLTPAQILNQESTLANQANQAAAFTSTGMSYYSSLVSPPDIIPPSTPTIIQSSSGSPTAASLSWSPSTDNVGVAGYNLWRNGIALPATAFTHFKDSGLTDNTSYTYQVAAFDLGGNISPPATVSITTQNTTPPNAPSHLAAVVLSGRQVTLSWNAPAGNVPVTSYLLFRGTSPTNLTQIQQLPSSITSGNNSGLTPGATYYYGVQADSKGLVSPMSNLAVATTPAPPTAPAGLAATAAKAKVTLTWSCSPGGLPIANYHIYRGTARSNLAQVAVRTAASYTDTAVTPATTYYYAVQAADTAQDLSPMSAILAVTLPAP
jgi:chitodextrinase